MTGKEEIFHYSKMITVLYAKKEKMYPAYVSNHNSNSEKRY